MNPFTFTDTFRVRGVPYGLDFAERLLATLDKSAADPTNIYRKVDRQTADQVRQALQSVPERQDA